ncbi:MAG: hypothetical protein H7Z38_06875 [Rubrivivax sp.]|nr:hypothetical protein [Pyrinomonadaceae bacterium]
MRRIVSPSALIACLLLAGCGAAPPAVTTQQNSNSTAKTAQAGGGQSGAASSNAGVISSHSGAGNASAGGAATSGKPSVETPELDAKIEKAAAKAKASGASAADKKSAAAAYMERADFYWAAGNVQLYRYALGDYRRVLRFDPENGQAKERIDYLISVYQSLNRPVPENGLEN